MRSHDNAVCAPDFCRIRFRMSAARFAGISATDERGFSEALRRIRRAAANRTDRDQTVSAHDQGIRCLTPCCGPPTGKPSLRAFYSSTAGVPNPPPPGVCISTSSSACMAFLRASRLDRPLIRNAPGGPPARRRAIPCAGACRRLGMALISQSPAAAHAKADALAVAAPEIARSAGAAQQFLAAELDGHGGLEHLDGNGGDPRGITGCRQSVLAGAGTHAARVVEHGTGERSGHRGRGPGSVSSRQLRNPRRTTRSGMIVDSALSIGNGTYMPTTWRAFHGHRVLRVDDAAGRQFHPDRRPGWPALFGRSGFSTLRTAKVL